jgi:hypothetical protein
VDEARHAVFFNRFMREVVEASDGTIAGALQATRPELTWGFTKTFEMLDRVVDELRRDRSRTKLAQAVTMYHFVVEATLAQPGQHFISDYLSERDLLPGFREGIHAQGGRHRPAPAARNAADAVARTRPVQCLVGDRDPALHLGAVDDAVVLVRPGRGEGDRHGPHPLRCPVCGIGGYP